MKLYKRLTITILLGILTIALGYLAFTQSILIKSEDRVFLNANYLEVVDDALAHLPKPVNKLMYLSEDCDMVESPNNSSSKLYSYKKGTEFSVPKVVDDYYMVKGYSQKTAEGYIPVQFLSEKQPTDEVSLDSLVVFEGNPDESLMKVMRKEWWKLPKGIRSQFVSRGWSIRVATDGISLNGNQAGGITYFAEKYILFPNDTTNIECSFLHEIGHFVDYMVKLDEGVDSLVSKTPEWSESCFNLEKGTVNRVCDWDMYGLSSESEYFASCFKTYIRYPDALETTANNTYNFIHSIVEKYK